MPDPIPLTDPTTRPAWKRLQELADDPIDLTSGGVLSPDRIEAMRASAAGFDLLYATERVTEEVLAALEELARESRAVEQFAMMMRGEVMNRIVGHESEERQVLHTASRNVFQSEGLTCPHDDAQADAAAKAEAQLENLKDFLAEVRDGGQFTDLVQIGIGGSELGPGALYLALPEFWQKGRRVHFISNVDPDDAAQELAELEARKALPNTLVVVISKSGTTLETLTNEALVADRFRVAGLDPKDHFLCVTSDGSPMATSGRYRRVFLMYDYIGGRFSATSMVGGVPLGFGLGYDRFVEILRGAREMDLNALEPDIRKNLALLSALIGIWNRNFLGHPTVAILPYSQMLNRFVAHLQQLDMESNGKRVNRCGEVVRYGTGPVVWGEPGANGQHAFYQLIHQSETIIPCEFIGFRHSQAGLDTEVEGTTSQQKLLANLLAQAEALATGQRHDNPNKQFPGNRPSSILIADKLTPRTIGALLAYYENKIVFQGFIWNINSFDQEGVQLGKKLAGKYIAHFKAGRCRPDDDADDTGWAMMDAAGLL